jgi:hypothetical protein
MNLSLKIAAGSLAVSLLVLTIKYAAYLMTGSVALYSDALESIVNVVTAGPRLWLSEAGPVRRTQSTPTVTKRRNTSRPWRSAR